MSRADDGDRDPDRGGRRSAVGGLFAALVAFAVLAATEPSLAIVWDEGFTLGREERIRAWLRAMADPADFARTWSPPGAEWVQPDGPPPPGRSPVRPPTREAVDSRADLLAPPVVAYFWPFAREEPHGHPPFYALLGLAGDLLTPWRDPLGRGRLGPMILFAAAVGAAFAFLDRRRGRWAAIGGSAALLLQPRLFGHAHYAAYDGPLTALWALGVIAFAKATEDARLASRRGPHWPWAVAFGIVLGAAMATKFTGWLLPMPMLAWAALYRDRRAALASLAAAPVAILTAFALVPPWWADPIDGVARFLGSNLGRAETINISVQFLGEVYQTPTQSLPWSNTLVWTAVATPIGFLLLAMVGALGSAWRIRRERLGVLIAGHWLFLLILRALPHVPGHDGIRLFLPAFGMLAMAAGIGAGWTVRRFGRWGKALVAAAIAEGAVGVLVMMPVPLAFASPAVGGPAGAARLGMEPTYYWDALDRAAIAWLDRNTEPGRLAATTTYTTSFAFLNQSGRVATPIVPAFRRPLDPRIAWVVVQNRPGDMNPLVRRLVRDGRPAFTRERLGVPLLWVFPADQFRAAYLEQIATRPGAVGP